MFFIDLFIFYVHCQKTV